MTDGSHQAAYLVAFKRRLMFRFLFPFFSALLVGGNAFSQGFESIYPGLSGEQLLDSVAAHYRPNVVLDYANSRDTLYAKVLALDDDSIRCIYSGHTLYLDPTQDPTQYIYLNGSTLGMNTEHAYPQSKGAADGNARSDMHHLFPARIPVNEARGDVPYADIPDAQTQKWFRGAQVLLNQPAQNKDQYSEFRTGQFEPRESVKGDLARAVFYFYTMYRVQADAADPNYFESQRLTLCQWAAQDPADSAELTKTWRIAHYQENKPNPFIVDCTLAHRCWCPEVPENCAVPVLEPLEPASLALRMLPNPAVESARLEMMLPFSGALEIRLLSMQGQEIKIWRIAEAPAGSFNLPLGVSLAEFGSMSVIETRLLGSQTVVRQAITVMSW